MAISDTISSIEDNIRADYEGLENIGADLTGINKNILNIRTILDTIYNDMPKVTGEGTEVTLTPTRKGRLAIIPKGNSEQGQKKSPNLYNVSDFYSGQDYSVDSEGFITIAYDNTSGTATHTGGYSTNNLDIQASTTYLLVAEIKSVSGTGTMYFTNRQTTSNQGQFSNFYKSFSELSNGQILAGRITSISAEDMASVIRGLRTVVQFNAGQSGSITFRLSVLADTTITPQTFHYLPFGNLDPQPYFPIPIKSVTGNNNVVVRTENLFTGLVKGIGLNTTTGEEQLDQPNKSVSDYIPVNFTTNPNYYVSGLTDTLSSFVNAYNSSKQSLGRTTGTPVTYWNLNANMFTSGTPQGTGDIAYLRVTQYYVSGSTGTIDDIDNLKIMLNTGNSAKPYQPYGNQTLPLNLGTIELNKIGNYQDYIYKTTGKNLFDVDNLSFENAYIDNSGTITPNNNNGLFGYVEVKPNEYYTFSLKQSVLNIAIVEFNSQKTFIKRTQASNTSYNTIQLGSTTEYIRIFINTTNQQVVTRQIIKDLNPMFNIGDTALPYEPYGSGIWYKKEEIGQIVLNGTENWLKSGNNFYINGTNYLTYNDGGLCYVSHFIGSAINYSTDDLHSFIGNSSFLIIRYDAISSVEDFKTWLSNNNVTAYYILATPTDIEITDTQLIEQLNEIEKMKSYNGTTIITSTFDSNNAQMILSASSLKGE